ncbi:MAG: type II toxin-antitoxin system VapC family toxin, partial [Nevskiales bacterium]
TPSEPAVNRWMRVAGRVLLDTNIVIALFAAEPEVLARLQQQSAVYLSVPVLGELRYGAMASSRVEQNLWKLDELAQSVSVLACDVHTADFYARAKAGLRSKGRPIPENDVWIAAIALQHGLTLATRDNHFEYVNGLSLELW